MPLPAIRSKLAAAAVVAAFVACPAAASAQSGTAGYSPSGGTVEDILSNAPTGDDSAPAVAGEIEECAGGTGSTGSAGSNGSGSTGAGGAGGGAECAPAEDAPVVAGDVEESAPSAGDPAVTGAADPAADVESGAGVPVAATTAGNADELPFTGMDAGLIALLGAALIGTGFGLRRAVRSRA